MATGPTKYLLVHKQECGNKGEFICNQVAVLVIMVFAPLFLQRDLGQIARLMASTDEPTIIPKTVIFSQTKDEVYKVFKSLSTFARHIQSACTMLHNRKKQNRSSSSPSDHHPLNQEYITESVCNSHMVSVPAIHDVGNQQWICLAGT